jgi:hypothetical protein
MKLHLHPHVARRILLERRGEETRRKCGPVGDVDVCADATVAVATVAIVPATVMTASASIDLRM